MQILHKTQTNFNPFGDFIKYKPIFWAGNGESHNEIVTGGTMNPIPGMGQKSKAEALYLEKREWNEEEPNTRHQTAVFTTAPLFAQVPVLLLLDPKIQPQPKTLYAVYHSFCVTKQLDENPITFVSQRRIGIEYLGFTQQAISRWTKILEKEGWLSIIRQGQGRSNIIILHGFKGQKITLKQKKFYIKEVRDLQARYNGGCN